MHADRERQVSVRSQRYWRALRHDFQSILKLYLTSRRRVPWALLNKHQVDLAVGLLTRKTRRGDVAEVLTPRELSLIWDEWVKSDDDRVFTYVVRNGPDKGERRAITPGGVTRAHRTACQKAGLKPTSISDFRLGAR